MNPHLDRLFDLVRRTGQRLVVLDGEQEPLVVLPLGEFERIALNADQRSAVERQGTRVMRQASGVTGQGLRVTGQRSSVIEPEAAIQTPPQRTATDGTPSPAQQPPWVKQGIGESLQADQPQPLPAPHRGEPGLDEIEDEYFPEPLE